MATKKELSARARKAWRTRRNKATVGGVPKEYFDAVPEKIVLRKYSKKIRHLAALKAWKTRRAIAICQVRNLPVSDPSVQHSCKGASEFEASGKGSVKRHNAALKAWKAALKAWKTRRVKNV